MILRKALSNVSLPEKHHTAQNVCDVLLAQLAEIITDRDIHKEMSGTTFTFDEPYTSDSDDPEKFLDWLIAKGQHSQVATAICKRITIAVLEDFMNFISESLNASKTAKFSVAYSLLRKPFVDELLMFEEILNNKDDFANRYYILGDINLYDPSKKKDSDKKRIIDDAVGKIPMGFLFEADRIFEDRYDKDSKSSLNWISNHGIHIVTNDRRYRTLDKELNFVFATTDDYENFWNHYYDIVARLLFYTVTVIDQIVCNFIPSFDQRRNVRAYRRLIAYITYRATIEQDQKEVFKGLLEGLTDELQHTCKACQKDLRLTKEDIVWFAFSDIIKCKSCSVNQFDDAEFLSKFHHLD